MLTIRPAVESDARAIAEIYNYGIAERGATFETALRTSEMLLAMLRDQSRFPQLVATDN